MNLPRRTTAPDHAIFYFDFRDPYAYLAAMRIPRLCSEAGWALTLMPIDSRTLGNEGGMTGPHASDGVKGYVWADVARTAARMQVPFRVPASPDFDPRPLLRVCVFVKERSGQEAMAAVADSLWHEIWERGADPAHCESLLRTARDVAIPETALRDALSDPRIDGILERQTTRALQRGVFTVPTVEAGERLYSGLEELARLEAEVRGAPLVDRPEAGRSADPKPRPQSGMPDWTFSG